jgi:membrane protein YqaA with SNARE-associated domain
MPKLKPKAVKILKIVAAGVLFGIYWYWINQTLITDSGQVFGLLGFFLLMSTATAYFPLPANLLVLGAVKSFDPLIVSLVGGFATLVAYFSEFIFFTVLFKFTKVASFKNSWLYKRVSPLFDKHRFFILSFASFLPIPSEPLRIYAITRKYPKTLYIFAGFIGRVPRYFLLGYFGKPYVNSIWFIVAVIVFPVLLLLIIRGAASATYMIKSKYYAKPVESSPLSIPVTLSTTSGNSPESEIEAGK